MLKVQAQGAPQPLLPVVNLTTAHVAVGALVLITSLYFTYQTHRYLSPRKAEKQIASAPERASV
jgi:hypothetical protein